MEKDQYIQIASFEHDNWWYRSRRDLVDKIIKSHCRKWANMLDVGCGVGSNAEVLLKYSQNVCGLDMSRQSLEFCSKKGYTKLIHSTVKNMSLSIKFDLILCMDVLEHIKDDHRAVCKLKEHLSKDGILIISVPAHMYLWNDNDVFSHHLRRYKLKRIVEIVKNSGLSIIKISYWNQFTYLPCLFFYFLRKMKPKKDLQNNLNLIPAGINNILYKVLIIENLIFIKLRLLQGVSIVCVCKKEN
jgi:predicted TPR repeat methyltransferase